MTNSSSYIDLAVSSISMFMDDGTLDRVEVEKLLRIAFADGELDADERRVLARIFDRVDRARVTDDVWQLISTTRSQFKF